MRKPLGSSRVQEFILEKLVHVLRLAALMSLVSLGTFVALVAAYKLLF